MKKMRKISFAGIVALIVCLSFCFGAIPAAAVGADVTIEADAITVAANEENVYELTVWGNSSTPFASYQVSLTLPSFARVDAVEALTNGQGDVFSGRGYGSTAAATLSSNVGKSGKVALFAVRFTVSDAETGSYAVTANNLRVTNAEAVELNAEFAATYVQVATPGQRIKGDWNGDGSVTLTDVMGIQQHIVNNMLGTPRTVVYEKFAAADIDGNGEINITDCQYIQRYIIGAIDSLDNIGGHGSDDKEIVGIQAHYTGGEVMVGNPIPRDNIEVYLCYSDQSVVQTYEFSIGDYDQTQAGTISVPVCCGKFSTEITVTFYSTTPALEGTYTGEAGTLKLYYNAQYDMHVFGLQLNGVADEISGLFEKDGNTLYLADRTNWCDLYVVTVDIADRTFTLDKTYHFNEQGDVDYDDWQGTYTVAEDGSSIWLGQYGGFMRFEYDESGQVNTAIYTGTYDMGDGVGTAYVFGTDQDDCMLAVDFWITDTQDRVISLEPPTFYQAQLFFYVDGVLYRSPEVTAPEGTTYSGLASWAAGFFCDMYPGDLNTEWDLVYPEGVTDDTLVEDGATVSLYFTTSVAVTYDMEITFYVDDEPVLTQAFEAAEGSLYVNAATEAAELFISELYEYPLSDNWYPVYAEGVTNNTTVTGNDAFSLYFETPVYRVNVHLYVDGQLVDDERYVTSPAFSTYYDVARVAARSYRERLKSYILSDEWDFEIPEDASADDLVADGSLMKIYYTSADTFYAVADDVPEIYPVLHFEADGTVAVYDFDGTLLDDEFGTYEMLRKDGIVRAYITSFGNYMVSGASYVHGEGEDAVTYPLLTPFRHGADETCTSYTFDFTAAAYRFDCYADGCVEAYYKNAGDETFTFSYSDGYTLNADDNTLYVGGTLYTIGENNDLYIPVPETGFLFETPFPLWQDNTTLAVYDNGMAYRIYKGESVVAAIPWEYETEYVIYLPDISFRYFRWEIDEQWHFVANYNDVAEWDNTVYNNNGADLTVYMSDDGKTVIVYDGERATYGEINGHVLFRYDYHNDVDCFILQEDNAWHAATRNPIKHKYRLSNESTEIFEYTGEIFFSDEIEGEPRYVAIVGLTHLPTFDLLFTCTVDQDGVYCLSHDGVEVLDLVFNAEQGVYYISAIDDLQHAVNVRFVKDDETVETTMNATLFHPLVSNLIGRPAMLADDPTNYIVTGIYTDEDRTQAVADDYIFTDAEGALLFYLTVAECTPADIVGAAYELEPGARMDHPVILTGTVTGIQTNYNLYYHNVSVWLTVEGLENYPILCYRLKATGFSIAPIAVGDVITVRGTLTNYKGTVEFASGCEVIDLQPAERPEEWDGTVTVDATALGNEISDVHLYAWYYGCDDNPVAWPGTAMTLENGVYTGVIDTELTLSGIVISWTTPDEEEHQTYDLFLPASHVITLNTTDVKN